MAEPGNGMARSTALGRWRLVIVSLLLGSLEGFTPTLSAQPSAPAPSRPTAALGLPIATDSPHPAEGRYPIELVTALRLAGASNLQIGLAAERVRQAQARAQGANALWLPSLTGGV